MNLIKVGFLATLSSVSFYASSASYDVAAYVWPAYHPAARWAELGIFNDGKGEWQNLYESFKRYPDDCQGVRPLWGYENEADPVVVARKIDAATAAGVNVFIYDWYWYGGRPFLEEALDKGFLNAQNCERMKFYLMWANHVVNGLWNNKVGSASKNKVIWDAKISDEDWQKIVELWISYFKRANYYRINGCPVIAIYDSKAFVNWEGLDIAKKRIAHLRFETMKAGFSDVHLQLIAGNEKPVDLGADSMTTYNWNYRIRSRINSKSLPELTYKQYGSMALAKFEEAKLEASKAGCVFFPNISCGWDTNARYPKGEKRNIVHGANPSVFEDFARQVKTWAEDNIPSNMPKLITINSWNEWTEGSYLEPDDNFGYGYLNALWHVFVSKR